MPQCRGIWKYCLKLRTKDVLFLVYFLSTSVILLSLLMILFYSKCDQAYDLWQQLELASELESDL